MTDGRIFAAVGAGLAFLGVAAGAFGTHVLEDRLTGDLLDVFNTAVDYQLYHALGLLLVGGLAPRLGATLVRWAGILFVSGTIVFSGSLYLLALTGVRWLGAITPIGGVCFLAGWGALCWSLMSKTASQADLGGP
jgi:uncharacterized membrane protein YgdD (TMEM256/DUF423 family)